MKTASSSRKVELTNAKSTGRRPTYRLILAALASNRFFYLVLLLVVSQALWFIFSFQPLINDEMRHFQTTEVYTHHLSPFLGVQRPAWDHLGEIARDGSFIFYWIMSWPLRLLDFFTTNQTAQIIGLRLVCTVFFTGGLILVRRALIIIGGLPRAAINLIILLFILTPAAGLLPATINYDNLVFLLFGGMLLLAVLAIRSPRLRADLLFGLVIIGLLISVVKWTSIALFAPVALFVAYDLIRKSGRQTFGQLAASLKELSVPKATVFCLLLVAALGLFFARPVANYVQYHKFEPPCQVVIGQSRCEEFSDYVSYRQLDQQKPVDFKAQDPVRYFFGFWLPTMADKASNLLERGPASELPVIKALDYALALVAIIIILVGWRFLSKTRLNKFLLFVTIFYTGALLIHSYLAYRAHGAPVAIRARYLLPVLPLIAYLVTVAAVDLWGKYKKTLIATAVLLVLLSTQGGGITTYLLTTPDDVYWQNSSVRWFNHHLRGAVSHLVKQ